jgi:hypothetical protein
MLFKTPQVEYPEIEEGSRPRHRCVSAYEQKLEPEPTMQASHLIFHTSWLIGHPSYFNNCRTLF